jgi:hypothetical protein
LSSAHRGANAHDLARESNDGESRERIRANQPVLSQ